MKFEVQQWADDIRSRVANLRAAGTQEESYTKMETCGERTRRSAASDDQENENTRLFSQNQ